ncbi:ATP-binding protein [Ramlibacter sp.]|uniref:ATP-binding protein n=1 Tax=Ramlibacter sp. TaxID=1917967 RepID=UPI0026377BCC|nr:ATP-binding protein [Ramlibacter sp.]MDB5954214.1 sensor histidine kinase [Ramlibacter sp.]
MLAVAPGPGAHSRGPADHAVRFYDDDQPLLDEVGEFLDDALRAGGHAVAIATPEHRVELSRRLHGFGGRSAQEAALMSQRLILLDAAQTLDLFMVNGRPDAALFAAALAPALAHASRGKPLHAFGEMVAVLCEQGEYDAALALEALWNEHVSRVGFSLFCAYPWRLFSSAERTRAFQHICTAHSRLLEPVRGKMAALMDPAHAVAHLQQQALVLEAEVQHRREAEQVLRARERELADFLDNASEGIHKVAADGTVLYANRAELEMLGYGWDEYVGQNIVGFYVDQHQIQGILERLKAGEVLDDEPALLRCKDGSHKPVVINSNGYFENGELVYTRCFTRDASERVAREQAREERNNLILQAPVGAALLIGPELRYELANEAWCRMLGRGAVVGRTFAEVFPELAGTATEQAIRQVLRSGEAFAADEHRLLLDLGTGSHEERFFKFNLQPLRAASGGIQGIIAVAVEVTEQVRARQELQRSAAEREQLLESVREASRVKDEFLAMLGHELRNPLSPIVTALQLMRMRGETGTAREQGIIQRQVDHLVRLVDDLLDISRVTRGKIELKRETCELSPILTKAVEQASILLEQRSHRLEIEIEPGLHCDCDPVRVAQVVANLLTNAARYTDVGGHIRLHAWRESDDRLAISVRDNGSGIAADALPRLFELFYQGERGVDRAEGGLGIGLALVRSLVELHGGSVHAHSEGKGHGSEFVVRLPYRVREAASPSAPEAEALATPAPGRRVLLVDDNVDAAEVMGELLRASGHEVTLFADPVSALLALEQLRPEVAVLDIGLPVMDGYELAARVRETCGDDCLLIALTGYGQENDRLRSRAAGFHTHLVKPVAPDRLLALLTAAG